jgi:chromosome segregation ATPase
MPEPTSNLFAHLGKPVRDEHGHVVGTMASFMVTPGGRINGVFIDHGDGHIKKYSSDQVKTEDDQILLLSNLKMRANSFCNQIPLLWRKTQAIKDLNEKKKIPEDMYSDLYSSFEGALDQLKKEAESAIAEVEQEVQQCSRRVKELNSALINLEIEREIGQIDEESYDKATTMVREGLRRVNSEKEDFDTLRNKLSNMLMGEGEEEPVEVELDRAEESLPTEETAPVSGDESLETELPEPPESLEPPESTAESPVVVYVKNAEQPAA